MLTDRKKRVLKAIIEEYINTAEPVSSGAIVEHYIPDCSSATIRNEMQALEEEGFLEKTHTSSGRIPSTKGYKYYVENGYEKNYVYGPLHGTGIIEVEAPWVETSSDYKLQTNMTYQVDT